VDLGTRTRPRSCWIKRDTIFQRFDGKAEGKANRSLKITLLLKVKDPSLRISIVFTSSTVNSCDIDCLTLISVAHHEMYHSNTPDLCIYPHADALQTLTPLMINDALYNE